MEIREKIDISKLRSYAEKKGIPIVNFLLKKIDSLSKKKAERYTLFAVCPNSKDVLIAAIRAAKRANSPLKFAATLNQVDIDKGYTGWNQNDLIRIIKEESYRIGYNGPIIVAVDHGGPWVKDIQTIQKWNLVKSMEWIKKSFEASIEAGYDLIHVDPTIDIFEKNIKIETIVERTIILILHAENFRKAKNIKPISYEVGTEEVHGGLANIEVFKKFLKLLKIGLKRQGLDYIWPVFIVAKVGTDLHTTTFDPEIASKLTGILKRYGSYIKGHYTDFVLNPQDYPKSGIGGANVGPEFTVSEYNALDELINLEKKLYSENKIAYLSSLKEKLEQAILESGRWKKWLLEGEKDFESLSQKRKHWILKTSCRYIFANPEIRWAREILYKNLQSNGIDAENWVLISIEKTMDKYFRAFNLIGLNEKLECLL